MIWGYLGPLTAKRRRPPSSNLSTGSLAGSSVGLQAVAQSIPCPIGCTDVMEAMLEILHRVHPMVARPERPRWVVDDATFIPAAVRSNSSSIARGTRLPTAAFGAATISWRCFPRGDKFLRALCRGSIGEDEIITRIPVKVAPQTTHAAPVGAGDGDQQIRGCVVEQTEAGGCMQDEVGPLLPNMELLVLQHQRQREALAVHLEHAICVRFVHPRRNVARFACVCCSAARFARPRMQWGGSACMHTCTRGMLFASTGGFLHTCMHQETFCKHGCN